MSTKIVPHWQKYDAAWEQAASLKERVITTLQAAAEKGFKVCAASVIDFGAIRSFGLHGSHILLWQRHRGNIDAGRF